MAGLTRLGWLAALGCALFCSFSSVAAAEDPAAPMFQPYTIDVIDLQLPQASIETLEAEPEDHYVEATFSLAKSDGTPGGVGPFTKPAKVGIRLKGGNGSFRDLKDKKAAFKIKFKEFGGSKFNGLKKLTLNNMVQDPSMLHETMAYEAFRVLGVPAPRTGYANVYVNGVNYGLHLDVETYDDVSLQQWFGSTRHLFEADEPGLDVSPGEAEKFEVDEGDEGPGNLADLEALIAAANNGAGDWSDGMAATANLGEMTRMWAVERYIGHWDGYAGIQAAFRPNNYFLHDEDTGPAAGVFQMLPWGTDQTWGLDLEFDEPAGGILFNECLADEDCEALYVDALREAQGAIASLDLGTQATCLAARLAPWQGMEEEGRREFDQEEIAEGVEAAEDFIAKRPEELADWLTTQAGAGEGSPSDQAAPCVPPGLIQKSSKDLGGSPALGAALLSGPPRLGRTRFQRLWFAASGGSLRAKLQIQQPGQLTLIARMPGRHGRRVCVARRQVAVPRKLTLRCHLPDPLRRRQVTLYVTIRFLPATGSAEMIRRKVTTPPWQPRH